MRRIAAFLLAALIIAGGVTTASAGPADAAGLSVHWEQGAVNGTWSYSPVAGSDQAYWDSADIKADIWGSYLWQGSRETGKISRSVGENRGGIIQARKTGGGVMPVTSVALTKNGAHPGFYFSEYGTLTGESRADDNNAGTMKGRSSGVSPGATSLAMKKWMDARGYPNNADRVSGYVNWIPLKDESHKIYQIEFPVMDPSGTPIQEAGRGLSKSIEVNPKTNELFIQYGESLFGELLRTYFVIVNPGPDGDPLTLDDNSFRYLQIRWSSQEARTYMNDFTFDEDGYMLLGANGASMVGGKARRIDVSGDPGSSKTIEAAPSFGTPAGAQDVGNANAGVWTWLDFGIIAGSGYQDPVIGNYRLNMTDVESSRKFATRLNCGGFVKQFDQGYRDTVYKANPPQGTVSDYLFSAASLYQWNLVKGSSACQSSPWRDSVYGVPLVVNGVAYMHGGPSDTGGLVKASTGILSEVASDHAVYYDLYKDADGKNPKLQATDEGCTIVNGITLNPWSCRRNMSEIPKSNFVLAANGGFDRGNLATTSDAGFSTSFYELNGNVTGGDVGSYSKGSSWFDVVAGCVANNTVTVTAELKDGYGDPLTGQAGALKAAIPSVAGATVSAFAEKSPGHYEATISYPGAASGKVSVTFNGSDLLTAKVNDVATFCATNVATVSGTVWADKNKNGVFDSPDDLPLKQQTVKLFRSPAGTEVATAVTDDAGNYLFQNIDPGSYYVQFGAGSTPYGNKGRKIDPAVYGTVLSAFGVSSGTWGVTTATTCSSGRSCADPTTERSPVFTLVAKQAKEFVNEGLTVVVPELTVVKTSDKGENVKVDRASNGKVKVTVTITNNTAEDLSNFSFEDTTDVGQAIPLLDYNCLYNGSRVVGKTVVPVGGVVTCTGTLPEMTGGEKHHDVFEASAIGVTSKETIEGRDDWSASMDEITEWSLTKTADPVSGSMVLPGSVVTYTLTLHNTGTTPVTGATVDDDLLDVLDHATLTGTLPSGVTWWKNRPALGLLQWKAPTVAPGESASVSFEITIAPDATSATLVNHAYVESGPDGQLGCGLDEDHPCETVHTTYPLPVLPSLGGLWFLGSLAIGAGLLTTALVVTIRRRRPRTTG